MLNDAMQFATTPLARFAPLAGIDGEGNVLGPEPRELVLTIGDKEVPIESLQLSTSVEVQAIYKDAEGNELGEEHEVEPGQTPAEYRRGRKIVVGSIMAPAHDGDPLAAALGVDDITKADPVDLILLAESSSGAAIEQRITGVVFTQVTDGKSQFDIGETSAYSFCAIDATPWKKVGRFVEDELTV